jgi:vancomycin resistance protein YoaR
MGTIYYPVRRRPTQTRAGILEQILLAVLAGFLIFGLAMLGTFAATRLWYAGRIFPGVTVGGVAVGGLSPRAAAALLAEQVTYPQAGKIILRDGEQSWVASPGELGLTLDPDASAQAAFQVGRSDALPVQVKAQIEAATSGVGLAPQMVFDQRAAFRYLNNIAATLDKPAVDASLSLKGTEVVVAPGQIGRALDIQSTLVLVTLQLQTLKDGVLDLYIRESAPVILDASAEADLARKMLNAPLVLSLPGGDAGSAGPWTIPPGQLAQMLAIQLADTDAGPRFQVGLRQELLVAYLADLAPKLLRYPVNARFTFNDESRKLEVIQPAVIGRQLNVQNSLNVIQDKLRAGEHNIALAIDYNDPPVTDSMTGEELGITELVQSTTSFFRGSSSERVQNIKAASEKFHGLMVAPGETFSMASAIGDITLDNGFAEALIIAGGQTIKGVGGGVCQVSTTLFRNVFFAGFPVVERYAHAYRVGYYEQTSGGHDASLAGLDATVFVPIVDFKFVNDTPYWLLMETYVNGYNLTWKFYSTSDGRTVDWDSSGPNNQVAPPEPIYRENPDLPKGEIRQVDWAAEGADVTVTRTVNRNGSVYFSDQINTHYEAWANAYEYGPGTELPPPEDRD